MLTFFFQYYLFIAGPVWQLSAIKCATVAVGWKWEWISSTSPLGTQRCIRWNVILTPETITHRVISDSFLICFLIYKSCMWTLILSNYWSVSVKLFLWIECGSKKENCLYPPQLFLWSSPCLNTVFHLKVYFISFFLFGTLRKSVVTIQSTFAQKENFPWHSLKEYNKFLILLLSTALLCSTLDKGKSSNKAESYGPWTLLVLRLC